MRIATALPRENREHPRGDATPLRDTLRIAARAFAQSRRATAGPDLELAPRLQTEMA